MTVVERLLKIKLPDVTVSGSTGSENVTVTVVPTATLIVPLAGLTAVTVGGVVSPATGVAVASVEFGDSLGTPSLAVTT